MEEKIEYAETKIEELLWKIKYHTTELNNFSSELELWSERLSELKHK